jgi:hypothetical protein
MSAGENQFSLTRAASITAGAATEQIPISRLFLRCVLMNLRPNIGWVIVLAALLAGPRLRGAPSGATDLKPGIYLFLDDALIERSSDVVRRINRPVRNLPGPVVTGKEDKCVQPYLTVLRDSKTSKFRMWYNVSESRGRKSNIGYLESNDGVRWIRPHFVFDNLAQMDICASVIDEGEKFSDLARRFKYYGHRKGMWLAHSADGLDWKAGPNHAVLTNINDILHVAPDPARHRYIALAGFPSSKKDGYVGRTQNSDEGYRRCVGESFSADGIHWEPAHRIFAPDKQDEGITEFYSIGGVVSRGEMLIGLLKVLRDDLPCDKGGKVDGIGYTVLAWSNDGDHWQRDREPFFDRNDAPGSWDHAMAWMDCQLAVGDETYIYYGGYARGHKVERNSERQIGLVRLKRDRYVAREAGAAPGFLQTRVVKMEGNTLALNMDAGKGSVRAQVEDEGGKPIRGFTFADCQPITGDSLNAAAHWKKPLSLLRGKKVRLEFSLVEARLFALEVK